MTTPATATAAPQTPPDPDSPDAPDARPAAVRLRGYRSADLPLLAGDWLPGELLGLPVPGRPPLADPACMPPPAPGATGEEVYVLPAAAAVRFAEVDQVHRRARLETGLRPETAPVAGPLLEAALVHAFTTLNLHRVYGWFTPAAYGEGGEQALRIEELLRGAGLSYEAEVPHALWFDGRPVGRQIWGTVRHG